MCHTSQPVWEKVTTHHNRWIISGYPAGPSAEAGNPALSGFRQAGTKTNPEFRPEANGVVERLNAEVKRRLQVLVNERQ